MKKIIVYAISIAIAIFVWYNLVGRPYGVYTDPDNYFSFKYDKDVVVTGEYPHLVSVGHDVYVLAQKSKDVGANADEFEKIRKDNSQPNVDQVRTKPFLTGYTSEVINGKTYYYFNDINNNGDGRVHAYLFGKNYVLEIAYVEQSKEEAKTILESAEVQ